MSQPGLRLFSKFNLLETGTKNSFSSLGESIRIYNYMGQRTFLFRPQEGTRLFYGWSIVAMAFTAHFMSVGTAFYAMNAFMEPLCAAHSWSRTQVNLALTLGTLFGFFGQFVFGTLVMRLGPRILMLAGSLSAGLALILLGRTEALWCFYCLYVLLYLANGAYGGIVANTAVSNWFVLKRGRALGIATAGISLSGAVLPLVTMILIIKTDLAGAFMWLGLMVLVVAPLSWLIVRNWPEEYGLAPDGITPFSHPAWRPEFGAENPSDRAHAPAAAPDPSTRQLYWTPARLVRTSAFWKLGASFALVQITLVGVMSQLKPRFADLGFGDMTAMIMMCAAAFFGAVGKYVWGVFCDRYEAKYVVAVLIGANALGLILGLLPGSLLALILFILVFGFAMGGVMSTFPIMVADLFGRESFAAVLRFVSLFLILQLVGYIIVGLSYDRLGSYDPAYILYVGLDLVALYLILTLKRPNGQGQADRNAA